MIEAIDFIGTPGEWFGARAILADGCEGWCYRHDGWSGEDQMIGVGVVDLTRVRWLEPRHGSTVRIQQIARDLGTIMQPTRPDGTPWGQWHVVTAWHSPDDATRTGYFVKLTGPGSRHRAHELAQQLVHARTWDAAERAMRTAGCPALAMLAPSLVAA